MVERSMALGCKPSDLRVYGGSNPSPSTMTFCVTENAAHVAQSVEHILGKDEVISSILIVGSMNICHNQ